MTHSDRSLAPSGAPGPHDAGGSPRAGATAVVLAVGVWTMMAGMGAMVGVWAWLRPPWPGLVQAAAVWRLATAAWLLLGWYAAGLCWWRFGRRGSGRSNAARDRRWYALWGYLGVWTLAWLLCWPVRF